MIDYRIVFQARGMTHVRYLRVADQEQAEQTVRNRYPYDPVVIVLVKPVAPENVPYPPKEYLDGLGIQV